MGRLIAELKERKVGQAFVVYLGSGWVVIEALNFFIEKFELGNQVFNVVLILTLCGLPIALLVAWFHGKPGHQKVTRNEILSYTIVLAAAAAFVSLAIVRGNDKTYRTNDEGEKSIAVLPFQNVNKDADSEFISDGITYDIIAKLSQLSEFKVISRTSSFYYKNNMKTLPEIGKELRVTNILEGTVRRSGNQVRITAELIDAMTDESLWVETFDRNITELFAIQSEVAERIAKALRLKLSPAEKERLTTNSDFNLAAYELYQKGLGFSRGGGTLEELDQAVSYFNQAIAVNPKFSPAYVALAHVYLDYDGWGRLPLSDVVPKARAAALKAIELNENIGEAYDVLAACALNFDRDETRFLDYINKALTLSPNFDRCHELYGTYYSLRGDTSKALKYARRAIELDPMSVRYSAAPSFCYAFSGDFPKAIDYCLKSLEKHPDNNFMLFALGQAYAMAGRYDEAIEVLHRRSTGTYTNWCVGYVYGKTGHKDEAEKVLNYLLEKSRTQYVPSIIIGYVYLGLGEKEKALDYLEIESEKANSAIWLTYLLWDRRLDEIRSHPRFVKLRKKIPF